MKDFQKTIMLTGLIMAFQPSFAFAGQVIPPIDADICLNGGYLTWDGAVLICKPRDTGFPPNKIITTPNGFCKGSTDENGKPYIDGIEGTQLSYKFNTWPTNNTIRIEVTCYCTLSSAGMQFSCDHTGGQYGRPAGSFRAWE